jgi:hypothetical protein
MGKWLVEVSGHPPNIQWFTILRNHHLVLLDEVKNARLAPTYRTRH